MDVLAGGGGGVEGSDGLGVQALVELAGDDEVAGTADPESEGEAGGGEAGGRGGLVVAEGEDDHSVGVVLGVGPGEAIGADGPRERLDGDVFRHAEGRRCSESAELGRDEDGRDEEQARSADEGGAKRCIWAGRGVLGRGVLGRKGPGAGRGEACGLDVGGLE